MRHFDRTFALTNRLRTEGTDHLLSAGRAVGVKRFVAQSYAGWPYARTGGPVKTEEDPLDPSPANEMRETLAAIRHLEDGGHRRPTGPRASCCATGLLRSRDVAGPGTASSSRWSASASSRSSATAAACGRSSTSPTPPRRPSRPSTAASAGSTTSSTTSRRAVAEWLPALAADDRGAEAVARAATSSGGWPPARRRVVMMTEIRGASNAKAKRELGWQPEHPSWREGFAA